MHSGESTAPEEPTSKADGPPRIRFEVLPWVRRVGTNSWMFTGMMVALR